MSQPLNTSSQPSKLLKLKKKQDEILNNMIRQVFKSEIDYLKVRQGKPHIYLLFFHIFI